MIKASNVRRRIAYQKARHTREAYEEELYYSLCGDCEIVTVHTIGGEYEHHDKIQEGYATYKWFGNCGIKLLQQYKTRNEAISGHMKWLYKEYEE